MGRTSESEGAARINEHVGQRLKARRIVMGMTQSDLAEATGVSYQQVQKYESGANRISAGRLYEIARKLDVDVPYFYEGLDPE